MSMKGLRSKYEAETDPNKKARIGTRMNYVKEHYGRNSGNSGAGAPPAPTMPPQRYTPIPQPNGMRPPQPAGPMEDGIRLLPNWGDANMDPGVLNDLIGRLARPTVSPEAARAQDNLNFMRQYTGVGLGMKPAKPMAQLGSQAPGGSQFPVVMDAVNGISNQFDARANAGAMANALNGNMQPMPRGGQGLGGMPQPQAAGPLMIPKRR